MNRYEDIARRYLKKNGYEGKKLEEIVSGFDYSKPVYEQLLDENQIVFQFVRVPESGNMMPKLGNWFCLSGGSLNGLAIISGQGRIVAKVRIAPRIIALEGAASKQAIQWGWSGGGAGGDTQIFIPDKFLTSNLTVLGYNSTNSKYAYK